MRNVKNIATFLSLILVIIPLIIIPWSMDYYYYPKIFSVQIVALLAFGVHIINLKRKKIQNDIHVIFLLIYFALVVFTTFLSINPIQSIWGKYLREEGLIAIGTYVLLFFLAKTYFKNNDKLTVLLCISATLVSFYGILQYFDYDPIPRDFIRMFWKGRAFSTMGNPNFLGAYLVLMLPLPIFKFLDKGKCIFLAIATTLYFCLLVTFTRSALLGFVIIGFFMFIYMLMNRHVFKQLIILVLVFAITSIVVNVQSNGRIIDRVLSIGKDAQVLINREEGYEKVGANRGYIWSRTLKLIKEKPLIGFGLENLETVFIERYQDEMIEIYGNVYAVDRAHNEYMHIAVSTGIPSLITYLIFIVLSLKRGFELEKKEIRYFPYLTAVSAYLVQAFFNISVVSVVYIFWIFLGVITNENVFEEEISV